MRLKCDRCDAVYRNLEVVIAERDKALAEVVAIKAKHEETLSCLAKVPTQPYEKEMAEEICRLRARSAKLLEALEKIDAADRSRGYPTGHEWMALIDLVRRTIKEYRKDGDTK